MNYKLELLKLTSGQEMVGVITELEDHYVIDNPYFLLPHSEGILLMASTIYGDPVKQINIAKSMVMFKTQIKDRYYEPVAKKWYENVFGSTMQGYVIDGDC